jgi:hypothetical protein
VTFDEFERAARRAFEEIPARFKEGIDGLEVSRDAVPHPTLPDVFTLGVCHTEEHLSSYGSSETTRSVIILYWGSFRGLAALDAAFDWEGEIWETLTHELRHHLESLAGDDALEDVDYAADELFNRQEGLEFDPWYYQRGEDLGGGAYAVEGTQYLEQTWTARDFERAEHIDFRWDEVTYRIPRPAELGDVHFVLVLGDDLEDESLELVLLRRPSWAEAVRRIASPADTVIIESEAEAEKLR